MSNSKSAFLFTVKIESFGPKIYAALICPRARQFSDALPLALLLALKDLENGRAPTCASQSWTRAPSCKLEVQK